MHGRSPCCVRASENLSRYAGEVKARSAEGEAIAAMEAGRGR